MSRPRKYVWLFGVGFTALVQLLVAYALVSTPDVLPIPPVRMSIIFGFQIFLGLVVGWQFQHSKDQCMSYVVILTGFYVVSLWLLYGPAKPSISGVDVSSLNKKIQVGHEALLSALILIGFAILNIATLLRLSRIVRPVQ